MLQRLANTRLVRAYMGALEARPLTTKLTSSGSLMAASDILRQWLEQRDQQCVDAASTPASSDAANAFSWDALRTCRQTSFAVLVHAPFIHTYHPIIERLFLPVAHVRGVTIAKVVFDQTLVAPPFLSGFLVYMTLAEGRTLADGRRRVEQQLEPLVRTSWTVWGLAHCVTFNLPVPIRLLWQDCVRLYFGTVMSLRSNQVIQPAEG